MFLLKETTGAFDVAAFLETVYLQTFSMDTTIHLNHIVTKI